MAKDQNKLKPTSKTPPVKANATPKSAARTASGAGTRTEMRRQERERQRLRQRWLTIGIIAVAVIALIVVVALIVRAPADAPIPAGALTRYDGITQTTTNDGFPRLGEANAPVQVAEFSSFGCPHCRDFNGDGMDQIIARIHTGKVAFTYVPLSGYGGYTNDQGAAAAALCAGEQGKFWSFHDALFNWQGAFGTNLAFSNNRIESGVGAFGLDQGAYNGCIGSGTPGQVLNAAKAQSTALLNFPNSTPTFTINGVVPLDDKQQAIQDTNTLLARIDAEIARINALPTAQPATIATAEATSDATPSISATTEATASAVAETASPATAEATTSATAEVTPAS